MNAKDTLFARCNRKALTFICEYCEGKKGKDWSCIEPDFHQEEIIKMVIEECRKEMKG